MTVSPTRHQVSLGNSISKLTLFIFDVQGGIGRERLTTFYRERFIFNNPADTAMELVSRTVGIDRVIDEFIFRFTHDKVIDWLYVFSS